MRILGSLFFIFPKKTTIFVQKFISRTSYRTLKPRLFRFFYFIVAYLLISVFMRKFAVGNVETLLPVLAALTGVSSVSVLFTARRFNKGEL